MKEPRKKSARFASIDYYIEQVVEYRSEYSAGQHGKDGYPPVVLEILLSIYFRLIAISIALGLILGTLVAMKFF